MPLVKHFTRSNHRLRLLVNGQAWSVYKKYLGLWTRKVGVTIFPYSFEKMTTKFGVALSYLNKIFFSFFISVPKNINVIYSLTGIICDVFPSFVFKLKTKKLWVANIDNVELPPRQKPGNYLVNCVAYMFFRFSIFFLRFADLIFLTTPLNQTKEVLISAGIDSQKIFFTNNGIPFGEIDKAKGQNSRQGGSFLGRIHPGKGVYDLVEIWSNILKENREAGNLLVIGNGEKKIENELKNRIKKWKLTGKVLPMGLKLGKEKYQLLKKTKIFINPSYFDANPISVVEALACGLPVLAYDLAIFQDYYPKNLVQTVKPGDIKGLSQKALNLLADNRLYQRLSKKGKEFARAFDWQEILGRQEQLITRLLISTSARR